MSTTTGSLDGLDEAAVQERVRRGDVNEIPETSTRSTWHIVRANIFTPFNFLLGGLLAVILVVGPYQDALFGGVLVANAAVGIYQELRAKRTLDRLTVLSAPRARVVRSGEVRDLAVRDVVLDDVLELRPGDQIVVDGEVLSIQGLEVDESLLTGESDPLTKEPGDEVLSGSFVAAGSGRYRATRVGARAYARQLANEAKRFTLVRSELRQGINRIIVLVTWALIPTAVLLLWSQLRSNSSVPAALRGAVAGTVAMVPEGLVLLTSVAFAVGVVRLGRRQVLVQELPAVEGLARVDVLCIDKTGTLTEGRLVVGSLEALPTDADAAVEPAEVLRALVAADPTPNATMRAIAEAYPPAADGRLSAPTATVPFSSARKWSAATFDGMGTWVLGAPDIVLAGVHGDRAEDARRRAAAAAETGKRVLLLAGSGGTLDGDALPPALSPFALVFLQDRLRPDAADTLSYFRRQGVQVKVISGDSPRTVGAIAAEAGLDGADRPVDATELPEDRAHVAEALETHSVFGRVTPRQKQAMVAALQSRGHVVAMTGDGVNDVLALKDADIGVAMGSGSAASRAAAQLVLLDSTFSSLPPVIGEGRRVINNIERTANLFLTKTSYALILALATGVLSVPYPFLPRHITLISTLTIGIPGLFLALEPNDERARSGFVRRVLRFAVPAGVLAALAVMLSYALVRNQADLPLAQDRTTATFTLIWIGLLVLATVAAPLVGLRRWLVAGMGAAFALILAIPWLRDFFDLVPPPVLISLSSIGIAAIVGAIIQLFVPRRPRADGPSRTATTSAPT